MLSPPNLTNGGFMSPQAQVKSFPGYGVVYPDGVSGVKVIATFTQGPSKTVNPDGSVVYTTPPPTIHELFGGGFAYASGERVTQREHLETLPSGMRERALKWFDGSGELSVVAKEDIPPLNLDEKQRPEPVFVLSSDLPTQKDEVIEELDKKVKEIDVFSELLKVVKCIEQTVKEQGNQIAQLKASKPVPKRRMSNVNRSEMMKARWAERKARKVEKNGEGTTETS